MKAQNFFRQILVFTMVMSNSQNLCLPNFPAIQYLRQNSNLQLYSLCVATCLALTEWVCEVNILPDASACFKSMSGKCAAGGSVVLAVSLSSCSFLFIVDEARPSDY